jgi:magnesium chelatase family protein
LTATAARLLDERVFAGGLTRRGATRVHRLAWTLADLYGLARPDIAELDVALRLRAGDPLALASLDRVRVG